MSIIASIITLSPPKLVNIQKMREETIEGVPCECPVCHGSGGIEVADYSCRDYSGRHIKETFRKDCMTCMGTGKLVPHVKITWGPPD